LPTIHLSIDAGTGLPPGPHTLNITGLTTAASGWTERDIERSVPVKNDQPIFMKLQVEYDLSQMNLGQPGAKYIVRLTPMAEDDAKYEIRNTNPAKN
jgi:hypothetical protein